MSPVCPSKTVQIKAPSLCISFSWPHWNTLKKKGKCFKVAFNPNNNARLCNMVKSALCFRSRRQLTLSSVRLAQTVAAARRQRNGPWDNTENNLINCIHDFGHIYGHFVWLKVLPSQKEWSRRTGRRSLTTVILPFKATLHDITCQREDRTQHSSSGDILKWSNRIHFVRWWLCEIDVIYNLQSGQKREEGV